MNAHDSRAIHPVVADIFWSGIEQLTNVDVDVDTEACDREEKFEKYWCLII